MKCWKNLFWNIHLKRSAWIWLLNACADLDLSCSWSSCTFSALVQCKWCRVAVFFSPTTASCQKSPHLRSPLTSCGSLKGKPRRTAARTLTLFHLPDNKQSTFRQRLYDNSGYNRINLDISVCVNKDVLFFFFFWGTKTKHYVLVAVVWVFIWQHMQGSLMQPGHWEIQRVLFSPGHCRNDLENVVWNWTGFKQMM